MQRFLRHLMLITAVLIGVFWLARPLSSQAAPAQQHAPSVTNGSGPDLIVASVTIDPPNPSAGDTADIIVTIKNIGDAPVTGFFSYQLYINPADTPPGQTTPRVSQGGTGTGLAAGETWIWTRTGHTFAQSNPQIYVWVDPPWENRITETNESNNLYQPGAPPTPTLTPTPDSGHDSYEEDDSCETAKVITTDGVAQQHNLYRGVGAAAHPDEDWIKFAGISGVTYLIEATPAGAGGADADLTLELHSPPCNNPALGAGTTITFKALQNDTYYVKAAHINDDYGPATDYSLRITSDAGCTDNFEPNNLCYAAGDLPLNTVQTHSYCRPQDEDWSSTLVRAGVTYEIAVEDLGNQANSQLELFSSCDDLPTSASGTKLIHTPKRDGMLYIRTRQFISTTYGAGTEHTLQVQPVGDQTGCVPDAQETDDTFDQAAALTVDGPAQQHNSCPANNSDFAKFTAQAGITYTLETLNLGTASDTALCLRKADGTNIKCDDDSGAGKGSRIVWQADAAGTYFLEVKERDATVAGPDSAYTLRARTTLCDRDSGEPDDSRAAAKPIAADGNQHERTTCAAGDEDWFTFTAVANATYTLETFDNGPEADTLLSLYDSDGNLLAENDDYDPGVGSQLVHTAVRAGTHYVKVKLYNGTHYGAGTEYKFRLHSGTPTATPSPSSTPPALETPTATPTPPPSTIKTLILVNLRQLEQQHGTTLSADLLAELARLAGHAEVQGQVIRLDQNAEVQAAYDEWNKPEQWLQVDQANAVASRIRQVIHAQVAQHAGLQYVVLVGDDRALPLRRIYDNTPQHSENTYIHRDITNPTGAAQAANYFLSDNYYGAREGKPYNEREIYIPDLAVGRLIETPSEIINTLRRFHTGPVTDLRNAGVLVTAWDFVQDLGRKDCEHWQQDLGTGKVACIVGDSWSGDTLRSALQRTDLAFKILALSGHANHFTHGVPDGKHMGAHEFANLAMDLNGALAYSVACHSGLNVPTTNATQTLDLAQAFAGKGASYVGNTGYGWGLYYNLGLSEQLLDYYTTALVTGGGIEIGSALMVAKQRYYDTTPSLTGYDEKVVQELTLYGLPMQKVETGATLGDEDDWEQFDTVDFEFAPGSFANTISIRPLRASFHPDEWPAATPIDGVGNYYTLDGRSSAAAGETIQPLHFGNVSDPTMEARSAVILTGTYRTQSNFTPVYAVPFNEYTTGNPTALTGQQATPLASPLQLRTRGNNAYVTTAVGVYDEGTGRQLIYSDLAAQIYYSTSTDKTPPTLTVVDGIYEAATGQIYVKVGATDPAGIREVIVNYITDLSQPSGTINYIKLTWDAASQKWHGSFPGTPNTGFIAQVIDNAGNQVEASNKGTYYRAALTKRVSLPPNNRVFIPVVLR